MLNANVSDDSRVSMAAKPISIAASMAFELEAIPYLDDVYRTALHVCPQSSNVSTVVQETYLRAWLAFGKYRPRANCKRWLFQILFNVVRLEWKACSLRAAEGGSLEQAKPEGVSSVRGGNHVVDALLHVPLKFREVLLLVDCQGFSYKEAGEILGLSSEVVARRIQLGRDHLHLQLCCSPFEAVANPSFSGRKAL